MQLIHEWVMSVQRDGLDGRLKLLADVGDASAGFQHGVSARYYANCVRLSKEGFFCLSYTHITYDQRSASFLTGQHLNRLPRL